MKKLLRVVICAGIFFVLAGCGVKSRYSVFISSTHTEVADNMQDKQGNKTTEKERDSITEPAFGELNAGVNTDLQATDEINNGVDGNIADKQSDILLRFGDYGDNVFSLQRKLYCVGYDVAVDGYFGNQTSHFIKSFQKSRGLTESGSLDKNTDGAIKAEKDIRVYPAPKAIVENKAPSQEIKGYSHIPDIKTSPGDAQQVIVVLAQSYGTIKAGFKTYEKVDGLWQTVGSGSAVTGKKGFSDDRREGDMTSPTGKYGIPFLFGNANNPGVKLPYRKVKPGDYWVSNKIIEEYNVWMYYDGPNPRERLYDYEELWKQPLYKYAAVIDFNYGPDRILGKGSAIFLHIAPYSGGGTLGCIGVSEANLLKILRLLDPAKKPVIIMGIKGRI